MPGMEVAVDAMMGMDTAMGPIGDPIIGGDMPVIPPKTFLIPQNLQASDWDL